MNFALPVASRRERLSEYSPLLAFPSYVNERGQLVQSPSQSNMDRTVASKTIYIALTAFLAVASLSLVIIGVILFAPTDTNLATHTNKRVPIIFVPDLFCTNLEVRIDRGGHDDSVSECPLFLSHWTPIYEPSLLVNHSRCLVSALTRRYDSNDTVWRNKRGVHTRVPSVYYDSNSHDSGNHTHRSHTELYRGGSASGACHYDQLFQYFHSLGYHWGRDLLVLPYDWRQSSVALWSNTDFHTSVLSLIEKFHARHHHRILVLTHGAGTDHALSLLRLASTGWRSFYIDGVIAMSSDAAGNLAYVPPVLSGHWSDGASVFQSLTSVDANQLKPLYQSMDYLIYKWPNAYVWSEASVIVTADDRTFTSQSSDLIALLKMSGANDFLHYYTTVVSVVHDINEDADYSGNDTSASDELFTLSLMTDTYTRPPFNLLCLYQSRIPAIKQFRYDSERFDSAPAILYNADTGNNDSRHQRSRLRDSTASASVLLMETRWRTGVLYRDSDDDTDSESQSSHHGTSASSKNGNHRSRSQSRSSRASQRQPSIDPDALDNHSALGFVCRHWARRLAQSHNVSEHLLLGPIPATRDLLPSNHRTLHAIDELIGSLDENNDGNDEMG